MQILKTIHEDFYVNKNGKPVNNKGRRVKTNNKGQVVYNNNGNPVYNNNGNPVNNNNKNNNELPKRIIIKQHPVSKFSYIIEKNREIEKKIKLDSKGYPERYSNGRPVILGEHGYPVNNKGQILSFDQKTGDLKRNSSKNPYVYNPYPGGFKIPQHEIIYRYPQSINAQIKPGNNKQTSFLSSEGPGQTQVATVFGTQQVSKPPGGFKVHKTPPQEILRYNNTKPGNDENISSPLLQQPGNLQKKNSALSRLFGKLSIFGKKK